MLLFFRRSSPLRSALRHVISRRARVASRVSPTNRIFESLCVVRLGIA
jgi:hypothetical protein